MDKILQAIKQLLESSVQQSWSPLSDIKKIYYGDPITVALWDCPALIVRPRSTEYTPRGNQYDQKKCNVEIVLVYNQSTYFGSYKGTAYTIIDATRATGTSTLQTSIPHTLLVGQTVTITGVDPAGYNGTYVVTGVPSADEITVAKTSDPWAYVSGWSARHDDTTIVYAVKDSIEKIENNNALPSFETAPYTVAGTIQSNCLLPYNDGVNTYNTASFASVRSVDYVFSSNRGFPAYEVIVALDATTVDQR